jgi:type I restriction enzyme R subunit/putative DNA methylase
MTQEKRTSGAHLRVVLAKASHAVDAFDRLLLGAKEMCVTDFAVLELLLSRGPMPVNAIGRKVLLTGGSITTAIDRLSSHGWVVRQPDEKDRRVTRIHLTAEGKAFIEKIFQEHLRGLERLVEPLNPVEVDLLISLLKKVGKRAAGLLVGEPGSAEPQLGEKTIEDRAELGRGVPGGDGWYSRGYLPHFDAPGTVQFVTFRLADSLPQSKLREIERELVEIPSGKIDAERRKKVESWLDAGLGSCALKHPKVAVLMQETLLKWDGDRYRLLAWCIMPNHVHVLVETKSELSKIVQSWKSFTGRWAMAKNAELGLGVPGTAFWMREYWDRFIRDEQHFEKVRAYIENNPLAAGLCAGAEDWPWSSAFSGNAEA